MKQTALCAIIITIFSSTYLPAMENNRILGKKITDEDVETCREELLSLIKKESQRKAHLLTTGDKYISSPKMLTEPSPLFKELSQHYLRSVYLPTENTSASLYDYISSKESNSSNVDSILSEGQTLLMCAVRKNDEPLVTLLLSKKADPNITLRNGYSALMFAIDNKQTAIGNIHIVKLLLDAGADANAKEPFLGTALDLAIARKNTELVTLLLEHVDEKTSGKGLITAMHIDNQLLTLLVLTKKNELSYLNRAYNKAKQKKNTQLCDVLLSHGALGTKKSILDHVRFKEIKDRSGKTLFDTTQRLGKQDKKSSNK